MTIKELENEFNIAYAECFNFAFATRKKCKAEGRMVEKDFEDGYGLRLTEKWNEEEKKQYKKLDDKQQALREELEKAKKAEREEKAAAKRAKKNAELGITEEQRKAMANAKRTATEIRQAQAEIAGLQIRIQKLEAKKAEYEKIAKGL